MSGLNQNILFQYFLGTATPLQKKLVEDWLQDEQNKELFYQAVEKWEKEHVQFIPDLESALARVMHSIDGTPLPVEVRHPGSAGKTASTFVRRIWWVAASVVLILAISVYLFSSRLSYINYETTNAEVKEFMLADGSKVVLNANSRLLVPRWGFNNGDREVRLEGEAAFSVKHTISNQHFRVNTDGRLNVEVLGTEFSVYSRANKNNVQLKKGSVRVLFKDPRTKPLIMVPGDFVNVTAAGDLSIRRRQPSANFMAWRDRHFVFDSTTLGDAVQSVHDFFGDRIVISDPNLINKRITGSFKAASSMELLSALTEMLNLELITSADSLILEEKNK